MSIVLFQIFALISPQTRIRFGIVICTNIYELMAIQTFKRLFPNSYFPAVLLLTIQLTTVFSFGKTAGITNNSDIAGIMLCQV